MVPVHEVDASTFVFWGISGFNASTGDFVQKAIQYTVELTGDTNKAIPKLSLLSELTWPLCRILLSQIKP